MIKFPDMSQMAKIIRHFPEFPDLEENFVFSLTRSSSMSFVLTKQPVLLSEILVNSEFYYETMIKCSDKT